MNSRAEIDLRHASSDQMLVALSAGNTLSPEELQAALANAFERIATIERDWTELGEAFRWLHEHIESPLQESSRENTP